MVMTSPNFHLLSAMHLLSIGYSVIPSGSGPKGKYPLVKWKEFQKRLPTVTELEYWQDNLCPRLWGVVTGKVSGIVVFDADDDISRSILEQEGLTPHVLTPRCANFWFHYPGHFVKTEAGVLPSLDVRGDNGFVNVVGTRRDGGVYRVVKWPTMENVYPWERLPASIAEAITRNKMRQPHPTPIYSHIESELAFNREVTGVEISLADRLLRRAITNARDGTRNEIGLWLCCQLRDNGFSRAEAESFALQYAEVVGPLDCEDPYIEHEALASLEQAYLRPPRSPWTVLGYKRFTYV